MKTLYTLLFALLLPFSLLAQGEHWVNGYRKNDGTYVPGHWRTNPNSTRNDNYSTYPNINPHTGKVGTKPGDYAYPPINRPTSPAIPNDNIIIDENALKTQLEKTVQAQEIERMQRLSRSQAEEQYRLSEVQSCIAAATDFYQIATRSNTKNYYRDGNYFMRFVAGDNTCYDAEMKIRNNRVLFEWPNCKALSYPIKHGRSVISVQCLLNDNKVHSSQIYFYLMHD